MTTDHLDDEAISAHLDGEATSAESAHLASCGACSTRLAELRAASAAIGAPVAIDGDRREAAIAAALAEAPAPPSAAADARVVPLSSRRRGIPSWLAAAAALLVVVALVPLVNGLRSDDVDEAATSAADDPEVTLEQEFVEEFAADSPTIDAGDIGELDPRGVRDLVLGAIGGGTSRRTTADEGADASTSGQAEESAGGAGAGGVAADGAEGAPTPAASGGQAAATPAPCEDAARADFPDLLALRYRAVGTYEGAEQSVLAFELDSGRIRVLVLAIDTCEITIVQELAPS